MRTVQFLVERQCPDLERHLTPEQEAMLPYPIWVEWPPLEGSPTCESKRHFWCSYEEAVRINNYVGIVAKANQGRLVCECMGQVIE
jgi:hypothetical protein